MNARNLSITVIGGGLAGVEAARRIAGFGIRARLYEMRPAKTTAAHTTPGLAELVCSNSLKSSSVENASGILKREMKELGSLVIEAAEASRVPAGKALAVDRKAFSDYVTRETERNPLVEVIRREADSLPAEGREIAIVATGPLTSEALCGEITSLAGARRLYFYDAISPIIDAESIDTSKVFRGSRYGEAGEGDYLNCPLSREGYHGLVDDLLRAEKVEPRDFEKAVYFEGCMPVETMCERGRETLRFGPLRPVGLVDPKTGKIPFAAVQLRTENAAGTMYNMVGFQTRLRYPHQREAFRKIPGLEEAEFLRYGSVHRNTYMDSPRLLEGDLSLRSRRNVFFAGQITGVEGYAESAATGIVCGTNAARKALGLPPVFPARETAIGSLLEYVRSGGGAEFQPMNINFGLFPRVGGKMSRRRRRELVARRSLEGIRRYARAARAPGGV